MKNRKIRLGGFTLVELLVVIVIIAALAGLSAPMILRQRKAADRTEAISNAKQVGQALLEFDVEFGGFPDNYTAEEVKDSTGTSLNMSGNFSNDYFRQLIAFGIQSEDIFYAKTTYSQKPDKVMTGNDALEPGEVGFGYIMRDTTSGLSTAGNPSLPVLAAPLLDAQSNWKFDPDPYGGKAVILRIDNSVDAPLIRSTDNYVTIGKGRPIQQTGVNSVWGTGMNPVIKAPAKRGSGAGGGITQAPENDDFGN